MVKKLLYGILFLVIVIALYNLFDWLYSLVMSDYIYQFSFYHSVAMPASVGIVVYIIMVIQNAKKKD